MEASIKRKDEILSWLICVFGDTRLTQCTCAVRARVGSMWGKHNSSCLEHEWPLNRIMKGQTWTGSTVCDAGNTCVVVNACKYNHAAVHVCARPLMASSFFTVYSQCQPGATPTTTSSAPGSTACSGSTTKFKYFGVNQSGAEFGNTKIPVSVYIWLPLSLP